MTMLMNVWTWWKENLAALVADDEAPVPKSVFATSPMWWGELLEPPKELE
jgi:hypothetical protein